MKTVLKNELSKFVLMVLIGSIACFTASLLATKIIATNVNDVMFLVGIFLTIGSLFSMIEGRPLGGQPTIYPESKYISSGNIDVSKLDKEKLLTSVYIIDKVKSTLLSTEFLTIGVIALMISYFI